MSEARLHHKPDWTSNCGRARLYLGDCREVMRSLPEASVDSVVTDPPYGLSFMGRAWDHQVPGPEFWAEALRVAKPGAHLAAMGGTRTWHRLVCSIEDAGWIVRDCLMWLYGSGFPKSHDVSKALDREAGAEVTDLARTWHGYGTALKPAWEPICLAMRPCDGTFAANAREHGVAGINVKGCRVPGEPGKPGNKTDSEEPHRSRAMSGPKRSLGASYTQRVESGEIAGRWPSNLLHDGECGEVFPETKTGGARREGPRNHDTPCNFQKGVRTRFADARFTGDSGSAARFFPALTWNGEERAMYCPKPSKRERDEGVDGRNTHPTVKPVALMAWLCRLLRPPHGGVVLDPFMGSGTTGVAAVREGREFIGIELDPESFDIARQRIDHECGKTQ